MEIQTENRQWLKSLRPCTVNRLLFIGKERREGLERSQKWETKRDVIVIILGLYGRTPKWTFEVGACGTPPRRRSRRLLWRSPLAWNTCAATDCDALRSIIGFVRASSGFFFLRFGALLHLLFYFFLISTTPYNINQLMTHPFLQL